MAGIFFLYALPQTPILFVQLIPTYAFGFSLESHLLQEAMTLEDIHNILWNLY